MDDHDPGICPDPTCAPCLTLDRHESAVRLELVLLAAELECPDGSWADSTVTVDVLDLRNLLDSAKAL